MKRENCPLCDHSMEHHLYTDQDGRQWNLFYCPMCDADFATTANGLGVMLEPHDTRPIKPVEVAHESH